jgi:hypothetical protein
MAAGPRSTDRRPSLAKVALPTEHGGWSLTLEPVLLGLIVAPTWAGAALGGVALLGFLIRTPLKLAIGDRRRGRRLDRSALAERVTLIEGVALVLLLAAAAVGAEDPFWLPLAAAVPLFAIEMWFDVRSKSRHLLPELAGTVGIGSVGAAIALAGGTDPLIAWGLWLIAAARAVAAIPLVRVQLRRAKNQAYRLIDSDAAQVAAGAGMVAGFAAGAVSLVALLAITTLAAIHLVQVRRPPPRAAVLGAQQVVFGLAIVVAAGLAAIAP